MPRQINVFLTLPRFKSEVEGQVQVEAQNGAEVPKLLKTKVK